MKEKLFEEANEFINGEEIEEMADVLEVINAMCEYKNFNVQEINDIRNRKNEERGAFKKKIILEES
ncbi:MAG TPA: hypothetical protein P5052_04055 [Candidatus Paceibacterota bacterium]|nr:hypothetical protein [Candidatus Paceibacterota bacterium]HRZ29884.1 hypothetical protein [Candidatus Paceibacterota bacterium]